MDSKTYHTKETIIHLLKEHKFDLEKIIALRLNIHYHPEGGFKEFETHKKILKMFDHLKEDLKITVCAQTGILVDIKGTGSQISDSQPKVIAFRADIDALCMKECNPHLPYAS